MPSEISRLAVPRPRRIAEDFDRLDLLCRNLGADDNKGLIEATDGIVARETPGLNRKMMSNLQEALALLRGLRLARN